MLYSYVSCIKAISMAYNIINQAQCPCTRTKYAYAIATTAATKNNDSDSNESRTNLILRASKWQFTNMFTNSATQTTK